MGLSGTAVPFCPDYDRIGELVLEAHSGETTVVEAGSKWLNYVAKVRFSIGSNLMAKLLFGERIGKLGAIRLSCSTVIFDTTKNKTLLTCRKYNGLLCLPGGGIDPGESVIEACAWEVWEETGSSGPRRQTLRHLQQPPSTY